jgi:hypothetical protein
MHFLTLCIVSHSCISTGVSQQEWRVAAAVVTMMRELRSGLYATERKIRLLPLVLVVAVLCGLSFYLGNIFDSEKTKLSSEVINKEADDEVTSSLSKSDCLQPALKVEPFPECSINLQDNTPCSDPKVKNNTYVKFKP